MKYIIHDTGNIVANLNNPGDKQMRCRFHLMNPGSGIGKEESSFSDQEGKDLNSHWK
ncbi:MAG: hypothetical protein PHR94_12965 [Methylomonas lenta]|nr:hypothetical protein [Methylomonas lenta]